MGAERRDGPSEQGDSGRSSQTPRRGRRSQALQQGVPGRENFVFATLVFAHFAYATLEFDISLLPLLAFDNTSQMPFRGKNDNFRVAIVIHVKS